MARFCCVVGCKSRTDRNRDPNNKVSFHSFPFRDKERKREWVKNISRLNKDGKPWQPVKTDCICSLHFAKEAYKAGLHRMLLQDEAVPTVFPTYPAHKQPKPFKRPPPKIRQFIAPPAKKPAPVPSKARIKAEHSYCHASMEAHLKKTQNKLRETKGKLVSEKEKSRIISQRLVRRTRRNEELMKTVKEKYETEDAVVVKADTGETVPVLSLLSTPPNDCAFTDTFSVTKELKDGFDDAGYIIVRGLLKGEELKKVKECLEGTDAMTKYSFTVNDGASRKSRLCVWNHPGDDLTGMIARSEKVVKTCEDLLEGEVYHYHTKLMMKEAFTGGKFVWHQDYGYWYKNGCMFPDMMTVFIAIDKCWQENGCLQVLEGSHKCGRIEHVMVGGQTGADLPRVEVLKRVLPLKHVELEPGDALFFHANLLHTSNANESPHRRWAFLCAYNRASNNPVLKHHHPQYTPLKKVPNSAVMACNNLTDMSGKDFMDPTMDETIKANKDGKVKVNEDTDKVEYVKE